MTTETKQPTPAPRPRFALNDQPIKIDKLSLPVKKVRDGVVKTAIIDFTIEGGNRILDLFDTELIEMFFKPVVTPEDQIRHKQIQIEDLDEQAPMPLLRTANIKWPVSLLNEYVGYKLTIDHGLGDHSFGGKPSTSNIIAPETTVKALRFTGKEGGSCIVRGRMYVVGMSGSDIGKMSDFIKLETKASAEPPKEKAQQTIDGTSAAFNKEQIAAGQALDAELAGKPPAAAAKVSPAPAAKGAAKPKPLTKAQQQAAARDAATAAFAATGTKPAAH